jgi:hypothetical protein
MEDFPQLITKWKEKRNLNVQMIAAEVHDEQPKITRLRVEEQEPELMRQIKEIGSTNGSGKQQNLFCCLTLERRKRHIHKQGRK